MRLFVLRVLRQFLAVVTRSKKKRNDTGGPPSTIYPLF